MLRVRVGATLPGVAQVTDVGVKELAALQNLNVLTLSGTKVTDAGVKELQKALPKCEIASDPAK